MTTEKLIRLLVNATYFVVVQYKTRPIVNINNKNR